VSGKEKEEELLMKLRLGVFMAEAGAKMLKYAKRNVTATRDRNLE